MWPLIATIGSAILKGAGDAIGAHQTNVANARQAREAQEFSAAEAQKNREFQDRESSTSYQRAVADMRAAGLNPALAYTQGGASSPGGSSASGVAAHVDRSAASAGIAGARDAVGFMSSLATEQVNREEASARAAAALASAQLNNEQAATVATMRSSSLNEMDMRTRLNVASAYRAEQEGNFLANNVGLRGALLSSELARNVTGVREAESRIGLNALQRTMLELGLPMARNTSAAADTWWGRNVVPYLNSAKGASNLFLPFLPGSR